jgi:Uma2 family endonuclease
MRIGANLLVYVQPRGLGEVFNSDTGFRIFGDEQTVRLPDVSFVRADRLPPLDELNRVGRLVPDLVVEVVSPSDRMSDVLDKIAEYLRAGVPLVWLVEPKRRVVTVYRPDRDPRELDEHQDLDGEEIVPGFRLAVASIFR